MAEEYSDDNLATYFGDPSDFSWLGDETPDHDLTPAEAARVYGWNLDSLKDLAKRLMSGKGSSSEYGGLASLLAGLYGANRSSGPTILNPGYRGGIPQVTATRTMLTQPPAGRRPGSGGINYGGDVTYTRTGQNLSAENAGISTPTSQAIGGAGIAGGTGAASGIAALLALLQQAQGGTSPAVTPASPARPVTGGSGAVPSRVVAGPGFPEAISGAAQTVTKAPVDPKNVAAIQSWWKANEGKASQEELQNFLIVPGYSAAEINQALPQFKVSDLNNAMRIAQNEVNKRVYAGQVPRASQDSLEYRANVSEIPQSEIEETRKKMYDRDPEVASYLDWKRGQYGLLGTSNALLPEDPTFNPYELSDQKFKEYKDMQEGAKKRGVAEWLDPNWREKQAQKRAETEAFWRQRGQSDLRAGLVTGPGSTPSQTTQPASALNLYEPGYEKRFGSTPPGSFVVGGGDGKLTPEERKAMYERDVQSTALGGARYLQDLFNYQPTGKSALGDLYTRAQSDPSLLRKFHNESDEDALLRLKANVMQAESRQAGREALRAQFAGREDNPFIVAGLPYGTPGVDPYNGVGLQGALENMRRIQAQNPQLKDLQSVISSITGTPFSSSQNAFPAPPDRIADETGFVPKKPDLQEISKPAVPVAPTLPGTGGPGATPSSGGIQDLFQQIYGRAGSESEVKNIAGLSPDQARGVLETSLANYRASQQPMHTAQPQGLPLLAAPQQKFEIVPPDESYYMVEAAKGGLLPDGFVVPADVVSHLGNGSSEAGLKILASKFGARPIKGDGDGMSDSIPTTIGGEQPARVANEEAFIPPSVVKRLGNGDTDRGAKKLYAMMDRIRKARTGTTEQGKEINPEKFMPGGKVKGYQTGGTITTNPSAGLASSSLAEWVGPYVADMLSKGQALTEAPYQAYTGPLTAGASQLQQQAFGAASAFRPSSAIGQAAGTAGGIASLAPNLRYTPQTTNFLGQQNVSGIDVSPSYGRMTQPAMYQKQPYELGVSGQRPTNKLPPGYPGAEPVIMDGDGSFAPPGQQRPTYGDEIMGPSQYDPTTGFSSRDLRPIRPGDSQYDAYFKATYGTPQTTSKLPSGQPGYVPPIADGDGMYVPPSGQYMSDQLRGLPAALTPPAQGGSIAQQYMNPFIQTALQPQLRELTRQSDVQRGLDAARLAKAGAFGGSRQAIMEAEGRRNLLQQQSDVLGQGFASAYDKAMAQFNADQARRAQEAQFGATYGMEGLRTGLQAAQTQGQLGGLESQYGLQGIEALSNLGRTQRDIEAEGIAADKAQFEEARLNPFKMLQFQQSLLSGLPLASQSLYQPGQSNLQQFASGATTVQSLLKALGLIK